MDLTQEDAGGKVTARVGEDITVALDETPTTGYRWLPDVDTDRLGVTADDYEGPEHPAGAGGRRRFTFVPLQPGPVTLRLVKRRPWEQQTVAEFTVTLDVSTG